jgi:hypothetical protein
MANQSGSETVIPFAKNTVSNGVDQLNAAGQTILQLLHKAAGVAEANGQHALARYGAKAFASASRG